MFHVINRGVRRLRLFDSPGDYRAFLDTFAEAQQRTPITCFAYCVMPNHFHLVLRPEVDGDLSRFMFWFGTTHAMRWHSYKGTSGTGAVYQGRFKALPVSTDDYFLKLCSYVERNPLRAKLVDRCENWPWSSLYQRQGHGRAIRLDEWPVPRPADWLESINQPKKGDTEGVRQAIRKSAPFGPREWQIEMTDRLRIQKTTREPGRPRKTRSGLIFFAP